MKNVIKKTYDWFRAQGIFAISIVFFVMVLNFGFGIFHLAKQAVVDEPLWTFDRIPKYWKNIGEMDWKGTNISDKPGITVALLSGIGLLQENPKEYESIHWQGTTYISDKNIEKMNFALRFPIFLFSVLILPLFYFSITQLLGKNTALFSTIFIGLSPITLGISRIINPDSLIWIFSLLSILSYLIFRKNIDRRYLYLAATFLGLAILTKYIANILFIYFFGIIFLDYILSSEKIGNFMKYIKESLVNLGKITLISLAIFTFLFPAVWLKPQKLLTATILSEAFVSTWPYFIGIIGLILLDYYALKSKVLERLLSFFQNKQHLITKIILAIFLILILATLINTYSGMRFFDFEQILASPKSSSNITSALGVTLANFYSLIFGIHPLILLLAILGILFAFSKKNYGTENKKITIFIIIFILLYYTGSMVNNVALTVRYQIILYPLISILAAISINHLIKISSKSIENIKLSTTLQFLAIIILIITLYQIKPFYFSYASDLLPQKYVLNLKDMGDGSYEAAEYLNTLPDAKNLSIWTDKRGVCAFFKGHCTSTLDFKRYTEEKRRFDYYVISRGRESRTTSFVQKRIDWNSRYLIRFDKLYDSTEPDYYINLASRSENYVRVINAEKINIFQ